MIYTIKNNTQYHYDLTEEIITNMEKEISETVTKIKIMNSVAVIRQTVNLVTDLNNILLIESLLTSK